MNSNFKKCTLSNSSWDLYTFHFNDIIFEQEDDVIYEYIPRDSTKKIFFVKEKTWMDGANLGYSKASKELIFAWLYKDKLDNMYE